MSNIEWTEKTWNPVTGCTKVSEGCAHCYAEGVANRWWGDRKFGDVQFHPDRLEQPSRRRKPTMYFVNSMSDLFHESVTDEQLDQIFAVMALTPQHTYQVLTKRPRRMLKYMGRLDLRKIIRAAGALDLLMPQGRYSLKMPLSNIWLGVTVENQRTADERIPLLLQTPAAVRFLSCEPLLEAVDLNAATPEGTGLDWVIVGGESGAKARPCDIGWIHSIVEQCKEAEVPCFVKQLGTHPTVGMDTDNPIFYSQSTGKGGNPDEWPEDLRVREYPEVKTLQFA